MELVNNYSQTLKGRINNNISDHTKEAFVSPILGLIYHNQALKEDKKKIFEQWKDVQKTIRQPIEEKYKSNQPTTRQKNAYISFDELIKVKDNLPKGSQERLLLMMYTEIPPVRSDYHKTKIYNRKPSKVNDNENYIILTKTNPRIILQQYKTSKTYKEQEIKIPKLLADEIRDNLKTYKRDYLFVSVRPLGDLQRIYGHILQEIMISLRKKGEGEEYSPLEKFIGEVISRALSDGLPDNPVASSLAASFENNPMKIFSFKPEKFYATNLRKMAINYLASTKEICDTVLLDPMYPFTPRSALNKQRMRTLRELVGNDSDTSELLTAALNRAHKRVAVKRPARAATLDQRKPTFSINSKRSRYDVYLVPYL